MANRLLFKILRKKIAVHLNFIRYNVVPLKNTIIYVKFLFSKLHELFHCVKVEAT